MSQTWAATCDGCGADLVRVDANHALLTDPGAKWLKVTESLAVRPRDDYDPMDFCSWGCLAAYAAKVAAPVDTGSAT